MFLRLIRWNGFSKNPILRSLAAALLETLYGCEIRCTEIDRSVLFAHHARGCTIVAAKLSAGVVIFQNVTVGSNLRFNKTTKAWENVGNPVLGERVIIADGAKVLGPVIVGHDSVIAAGALVTKDVPPNSVVYGVNQVRPKDPHYDLIFHPEMIAPERIVQANLDLIAKSRSLRHESITE